MTLPCLDIIIPHYQEKKEVISKLLSSINIQVGLNLNKAIKVTIVNDADENGRRELTEDFLHNFSFPIEVIQTEKNGGAGLARQYGIDHTNLPYIMFCDADDQLYDSTVLMKILNEICSLETKHQS